MTDLLGSGPGPTLGIGIADRRAEEHASFEQLYHLADKALYRAKSLGRNRTEIAWIDESASPSTQPDSECARDGDSQRCADAPSRQDMH